MGHPGHSHDVQRIVAATTPPTLEEVIAEMRNTINTWQVLAAEYFAEADGLAESPRRAGLDGHAVATEGAAKELAAFADHLTRIAEAHKAEVEELRMIIKAIGHEIDAMRSTREAALCREAEANLYN